MKDITLRFLMEIQNGNTEVGEKVFSGDFKISSKRFLRSIASQNETVA